MYYPISQKQTNPLSAATQFPGDLDLFHLHGSVESMEVASTLAGKIMDLSFGVAKRELGYMWNCSQNVETFKEEVEKLTAMTDTIQERINVAKAKGEIPGKDLENWMKNANDKISKAKSFITKEDESKKTCCNLGTLYHYGKTASKEISSLQKHREDGACFKDCAFDPLPTPRYTDIYQGKNLENIDAQKLTLKQIIEALEDDAVQIVGITGLGGVGKTTLASEVAKELKNKFDYIEFIAVSQTVNAEVIKTKVEKVASRKILNGEKVLIILDDVWKELKLVEVGIPCGSDYMNCKILLTSRIRDVCVAMNANQIISVNPLEETEAWTLFARVVGKTEWENSLKKVALEIVEECGGLPLFLQAVAKALKDKGIKSWEAALNRLKAPIPGDVKYKKKEILQLKLSYDYLEDEAAKSCFLLCSMFPEDADIHLERLAYYWFGLGIFHNPDTSIQDAKHIVRVAIDTLKSSFLLLSEEEREEVFKMHDLVRDMAMLVTCKDNDKCNDKFLVESGTRLTEWLPRKDLEIYNKISLMRNEICKLPGHKILVPHLDTFLIQQNKLSVVPDEFFGGMEKLKVLDMSGNKISSLPQSLKQLTILRLLDLSDNKTLDEICILGELTCLEILKLRRTGITEVPEEIGKLINLRLLDVFVCRNLSHVASGVISKLVRLEELYVSLKEEGACKFLLELTELKLLKILHVAAPGLQYNIPEDFPYETLIEFHIIDGVNFNTIICKRFLRLSHFPFSKRIMKLIQLSEVLHLWGIQDLDNILPVLNLESIDELKHIWLERCNNVKSLVKTCELDAMKTKGVFSSQVEQIILEHMDMLEVLWDRPHQYISFCNLKYIQIYGCKSLLKLFPLNVAQGLVNLRGLTIAGCQSLVAVISAGDEIEETCGSEIEETRGNEIKETGEGGSNTELEKPDTYNIVFPHLTTIELGYLSNLDCFFSGHPTIKYPSLNSIYLHGCERMKRWSYGESHMPKLKLESKHQPYSNINDFLAAENNKEHALRIT